MLQAIKYQRGKLEILDQLLLPHTTKYIELENLTDAWNAIKLMQVRGAPAIAIVGCLSIANELTKAEIRQTNKSKSEIANFVKSSFDYLITSRPTAVNLKNEAEKAAQYAATQACLDSENVETFRLKLIEELENVFNTDVKINKKLSDYGAETIISRIHPDQTTRKLTLLTHCNTGSLATAGYGTALGVIRKLAEMKCIEKVYFTETRPYNQGSRLTAYELMYEKIPEVLICDNMAGWLMKTKQVHAVIVGADRVVLNGDTANKIGTYSLAVLAKYHNVPFYVALPTSTFNPCVLNGDDILVEQRPPFEMTHSARGEPVAPEGVNCWNPAFDVTPYELVTGGFITEYGVFRSDEIAAVFQNNWKPISLD